MGGAGGSIKLQKISNFLSSFNVKFAPSSIRSILFHHGIKLTASDDNNDGSTYTQEVQSCFLAFNLILS